MTDADDRMKAMQEELTKLTDRLQTQTKAQNEVPHPHWRAHVRDYRKRDFWLLSEGLNLLYQSHPHNTSASGGCYTYRALAEHCIGPGGSLAVVNPEASFRKMKIRPTELFEWARYKNITIPSELQQALVPAPSSAPTAAALRTKTNIKQERLRQLRTFINDIEQRAKAANRNWDCTCLPVTKHDFAEIFFNRYPDVKKVSVATLADDLHQFGVKFRQGTSHTKNNVLNKLFNS